MTPSTNSCCIVGEIGLNHAGSLADAKRLISMAKECGCDMVKFQKRTPELCVPESMRSHMRETPWGYISYMEYRKRIEFGLDEYIDIDRICKEHRIPWFASVWDIPSAKFIFQFNPPYYKIPSPMLTNDDLLVYVRGLGRHVILSTGMSTLAQVDHAVSLLDKKRLTLLHCCSAYPASYENLNLRVMPEMRKWYGVPIGFSDHSTGIPASIAAVAMGACMIERHITLGRDRWGSDQAASLEYGALRRLVYYIRLTEKSLGDTEKKILPCEEPLIKRLRG